MAANISQRKIHAAIMAASILTHIEHELFVECGGCQRREFVKLVQFPAGETIGRVVERLKCQRCSGAPGVVTLTDADLRRQVRLVGPGACG